MATGHFFLVIVSSILIVFVASSKSAGDPLCEGLPADEVFIFPHEYNCSLYYECLNGNKTLETCPDGLWFNEKTESCDFPEESGCTHNDPRCVNVTIDYFPDPQDCSKYIECYQGNSYLMSCPNGYWFHSVDKMCVLPEQSDCRVTTTPPWTTPHPLCWGVLPNETVLIPYEGDCSKYWKCEGASLSLESCGSSLYFNEATQMCDFPDLVDCDDSTRTPDPSTTVDPFTTPAPTTQHGTDPRCEGTETSYWPNPTDCTRYIECYQGASYDRVCPDGLYFTDNGKKCVDPDLSECGKTDPPTPGTTTERSSDWTDDPDCPYPESEGKLLPFPGDCTQYYECAEGKKVQMDCPPGLWFNPVKTICDYPYQAGCEYEYL